jgi:ATPase subunit of ABC transporter with duplicated ATPase domains
MIQLTRVSIGYSEELLHAEKLGLQAGKVYALVGRNGIGKSTFIQTISGIQMVGGLLVLTGIVWTQTARRSNDND